MSIFQPLQPKRTLLSTPATPTSRLLPLTRPLALTSSLVQPSRPFEPLPPTTSDQDAPVTHTQAQSGHTAPLQFSIEHIPIFPPAKKTGMGLPDTLKAGVERLSGLSLDDVEVHYNSPKPAEVEALAYTQGTEIHIDPGQEKHLPHEAWHIVQQKQGRVTATMQVKGVTINDDERLEREADVMGESATRMGKAEVQRKGTADTHAVTNPTSLAPFSGQSKMPEGQSLAFVSGQSVVQRAITIKGTGQETGQKYSREGLDELANLLSPDLKAAFQANKQTPLSQILTRFDFQNRRFKDIPALEEAIMAAGALLYDEKKKIITLQQWIVKKHRSTVLAWKPTPLSEEDKRILTAELQRHPEVVKEMQKELQDLAPELISYSSKQFPSGTLQLTPEIIESRNYKGYHFLVTASVLSVKFGDDELGRLTITLPQEKKSPLKVGELEVHPRFRNMNLSRVLMVMLAQQSKQHSKGKFSVGQDTDITNKPFWNQYSNDAAKLLQRGDHQQIDVPANPLRNQKLEKGVE